MSKAAQLVSGLALTLAQIICLQKTWPIATVPPEGTEKGCGAGKDRQEDMGQGAQEASCLPMTATKRNGGDRSCQSPGGEGHVPRVRGL